MRVPTLSTLSILPFIALTLAQGGDPNMPGYYNTVAEIYSGSDCSTESFVWADPIFGRGGSCQLLDRNDNTPDIVSYKVVSQHPDCTATLYTDNDCLSTPYPAPVGQCVQAGNGVPFVKVFVQCPFSD